MDKPLQDTRLYRNLKLANNLEVLLVSDSEASKSGAALDVRVGSFYDPKELPGLAHFLEHLLFMGTSTFPSENEYSQFLTNHAGLANAYTTSEHTNYYFEVDYKALKGALHRFSRFFVCPLFSESCTSREINAVDSEHKKNLQSDIWRLNQVEKCLSNPNHPWAKFSTGNSETLGSKPSSQGIDVREEILKFYAEHYTASLMKLTVLGRESLDELESLAHEFFDDVPDPHPQKALDLPSYAYTKPLEPEQLGRLITAETVMDMKLLEISFPVADQQPLYKAQPYQYVVHLLGHESKGSLLSYLKEEKLATELASAITHVSPGTDYLLISIELTNEGMNRWKSVLSAVFGYIKMLQSHPPAKWIFDEVQTMCQAGFLYRQKGKAMQFVSSLAQVMHRPIPRDRLLSFSVPHECDSDGIATLISSLSIENCRVLVAGQNMPNLNQVEQWYGTKYNSATLPELPDSPEQFHLPHPNEFIPTNFDVLPKLQIAPQKRPKLVLNSDNMRLWHKQDDQFSIPKAHYNVKLLTSMNGETVENICLSDLFVGMVSDKLTDYAYYADLADIQQAVTSLHNGFEIEIHGFSENLHKLIAAVVLAITKPELSEQRFSTVKESHFRALKNVLKAQPYQMRAANSNFILLERSYSVETKIAAMEKLQFADLRDYVDKVVSMGFVTEALCVGNLTEKNAISIAEQISELVPPAKQPVHVSSSYLIPQGCFHYAKQLADKDNVNSALEVRFQFGTANDLRTSTILSIIAQIMKEPVFDQLRTKEQLGYIALSYKQQSRNTLYFKILVQSECTTSFLDSRIENFINNVGLPMLMSMTPSEFAQHVDAVIATQTEKLKNLAEECDRYWNAITTQFYSFNKHEEIAELAKSISLKEVQDCYVKYVVSKERARFALHLQAQKRAAVDLEAALARAVGQLIVEYKLEVPPLEIQSLMMECRGLTPQQALGLLQQKLTKYLPPSDAMQFVQRAAQMAQAESNAQSVAGDSAGATEPLLGEYIDKTPSSFTLAPPPAPVVDLQTLTKYE